MKQATLFECFKTESLVTSAISGISGGGMIFSFLGVYGIIVGSIIGGAVTGLSEYLHERKKSVPIINEHE